VGLALTEPCTILEAELLKNSSDVTICADENFTETDRQRLEFDVRSGMRKLNLKEGIKFSVSQTPGAHRGLGSGTSVRLAALEAASILNDIQFKHEELVLASGRGGASGIGVRSYFDGGFWLDLGRSATGSSMLPSAQQSLKRFDSLSLPRIPANEWRVILARPERVIGFSGQKEAQFFRDTLPLPEEASFEATYIGLMGLYASYLSRDFTGFTEAVDAMQTTKWKRAEWDVNPNPVSLLEQRLRLVGAPCVGLSSLGPTLFTFVETAAEAEAIVSQLTECSCVISVAADQGRQVSYVTR